MCGTLLVTAARTQAPKPLNQVGYLKNNLKMKYYPTLLLFFIIQGISFKSYSQKINPSCNFKKLSKLITEVNPTHSKKDLDKLFGIVGLMIGDSVKSDTSVILYKYQFCNDKIINCYTAAFLKNKLRYISKSFKNGQCVGNAESFQKNIKINSTYQEVKEIFNTDGDLKMIYWDTINSSVIQIEYEWMCCDNVNYYSIIFKDGKLAICNRFPIKQDYSRPSTGKKGKSN